MGHSSYNESSRSLRSESLGYMRKSANEIFTQNKEKTIHPEMSPKGVTIRESRDSENHPNSIPIIIALDFTGSMGHIPLELIRTGLPKIVSGIIQRGIPDPQVLFLGIGDHEYDKFPLQISQFESGDSELDMWLTRSFIEGGGGSNSGESYSLAHYFAANFTSTDSWEKRNQKGFLFTIGDEPNLSNYPSQALKEIFGNGQFSTISATEALEKAQEKWEVFHILPGKETMNAKTKWDYILGQNAIWLDSSDKVAECIRDTVISHVNSRDTKTSTLTGSSDVNSEATPSRDFIL